MILTGNYNEPTKENNKNLIPDVDPEYFRPLTENVAQYKDSLYLVKYVSAVEKTLSVIHLPDPQQELQEGVNIVGDKVYFIASDDVTIFDINGQWQWYKSPDGTPLNYLAHDDRYTYFIDEDTVEHFELKGQWTWFKYANGQLSDTFAHDDHYIYYVGDGLVRDAKRRNETRQLDAAHLDKNGSLLTVEGEYTSYNNELFPLND